MAVAAWVAVAGLASAAAALAPAGDPARGAKVYAASCGSCHSLDANRVGPAHRGVYGRKAGTARGYAYSPAMRGARIVWNGATLDRFLQNPQKMVPGTRMGFRLADPVRRADVIAYLRQQSK
ncbi:cytochrome C [Sphingopyxis lindanitolerans]|uniref:Cytochrome C n=1 Tax=Sphingopyxis lindanitolerans TaxID=2054227 RepID=A0A2S8B5Y0_9SPHN|nr:c-type cytochrome [Sphingopyxis lindanitolerans]PQM27659.1 cytochrome C [Sphingopyxis lindanitolerans]